MRAFLLFLLLTTAAVGVVVAVVLSGSVNVAASEPPGRFSAWALRGVSERSIARHARAVGAMPALDSAARAHGLDHFHAMCVDCHGAPGYERSEAGEGLHPRGPDLREVVEEGEWTDAELFWIVKHGIRMTGMPAFGPTHADEDLWGIVALVKELPDLSEADYMARIEALYTADSLAEGADSMAAGERVHVHSDGREHVH